MAFAVPTNCSFKPCSLSVSDTRIEVCTKLPAKCDVTSDLFMVAWTRKGEGTFHDSCWLKLLKCARAYNSKKCEIKLTQVEKNMIKEAAKTHEKHDSMAIMEQEGVRIADMIKQASHCCAFTGAGISTSAGIGDYRGKSGKWTEEDRETTSLSCDEIPTKKSRKMDDESDVSSSNDDDAVPYEKLRPTYTHEALVKLHELGYLKYVISQNGDGLHALSGIGEDSLSELHGNVFIERCEKCHMRYHRKYYVMDDIASQYYEEIEDLGQTDIRKPKHACKCELCGLCHRTGRKCTAKLPSGKKCGGYLIDTIINFRDHLEDAILDRAYDNAKICDVMLCLGTTLQVTPANELVESSEQANYKLVICNRQKTDMDKICLKKDKDQKPTGSRVYGDCDVIMREVMTNILSEKALQQWDGDRSKRLQTYDKQRQEN